MPTLNWIGKEKIVKHHHEVDFRALEHRYGFSAKGQQDDPVDSENMIIHGDNLAALNPNRSLEKVSCHFLMTAIRKTVLYMLDL